MHAETLIMEFTDCIWIGVQQCWLIASMSFKTVEFKEKLITQSIILIHIFLNGCVKHLIYDTILLHSKSQIQ